MKTQTIGCLIMLALLTVGCSSNNSEGNSEVNRTSENNGSEQAAHAEESNANNVFPLTGIKTSEDVDQRAIGIMIENSQSARPQSGLYQADVVYEVLSEGHITRLLSLFHSQQPERIGPVRSARNYYVHLNNGYDAIYASAGGSPGALELIAQQGYPHINALNYDGSFFTRWSERSAPHNMYTSYSQLVDAAADVGLTMTDREPPELPFSDETSHAEASEDALEVLIDYNSTSNNVLFDYDEQTKRYIRSVGGQRVDDLDTGEPVAPKNIFVVAASHQVIDDQGRRHINIESGGAAYLIQNGQAIEAEWKNVDGVILPFKDGEPLNFLPGQTWINFVEDIGDVSYHSAP
ncbi:DUF3048 domain-containing protein [Salipaludibacillus agaradhaerens]|uniref:DUF3048 domain-containing protein n=1 Tax=Salipaludibacillus agaradhaerens TaxID=76935 RepID=UPI000997C8B9|nr:DUF3048 domain-containing protein [Salipaludibacillus agaradhaerens]